MGIYLLLGNNIDEVEKNLSFILSLYILPLLLVICMTLTKLFDALVSSAVKWGRVYLPMGLLTRK